MRRCGGARRLSRRGLHDRLRLAGAVNRRPVSVGAAGELWLLQMQVHLFLVELFAVWTLHRNLSGLVRALWVILSLVFLAASAQSDPTWLTQYVYASLHSSRERRLIGKRKRRDGDKRSRLKAGIAVVGAILAVMANVGGSFDVVRGTSKFIGDRLFGTASGMSEQRQEAYRLLASLRPDEPQAALVSALGQPVSTGATPGGLRQDIWLISVGGHAAAIVISRSDGAGTTRLLALTTLRRDFTPTLPRYRSRSDTPLVLGRTPISQMAVDGDALYANDPADEFSWLFAVTPGIHAQEFRHEAFGTQDLECSQFPRPEIPLSVLYLLDDAKTSELPDYPSSPHPPSRLSAASRAIAQKELMALIQGYRVTTVAITAPFAELSQTGLPVLLSPSTGGLFDQRCS
jgi:hypothetical protein